MAKLYVFGIGGTGSRVLRSLAMLLAAGVDTNGYEIVPIIIDPDESNADLTRNVLLLNKYISIREKLHFTVDSKNKFFKTKIHKIFPDFIIPIQETNNKTFEEFIGLGDMSREDKAMAEMLFSQNNLCSSMNVGFKGNPNIGSVVLNQISSSSEFLEFANSFVQGDKIFIISSIFGGTGASGFPLLLKTLRQNKNIPNAGTINRAEIGAISVLPYFNLKTNENSEIDSSTFFSKTRAALKYYENNVSDANALYYIGDMPKRQYDNNEGGTMQENDAHLIEVLASTAIIDFCNNSFSGGGTSYRELGLTNKESTVTLKDFPETNMQNEIAYPLIELALFTKSLVDDYSYVSSDKLKANKKFKGNFYKEHFAKTVREYLQEFKQWLVELKDNTPSFAPFNMNTEIKELVTGLTGENHWWAKLDENTFRAALNDANPKGSGEEDKFMEMFAYAATKIKNKYRF